MLPSWSFHQQKTAKSNPKPFHASLDFRADSPTASPNNSRETCSQFSPGKHFRRLLLGSQEKWIWSLPVQRNKNESGGGGGESMQCNQAIHLSVWFCQLGTEMKPVLILSLLHSSSSSPTPGIFCKDKWIFLKNAQSPELMKPLVEISRSIYFLCLHLSCWCQPPPLSLSVRNLLAYLQTSKGI